MFIRNLGLKKEFKEDLKKIRNKNEILNLTQEDIIKNEDLLLDNESLEVAIVENIQRDDLNVIEEAKGYQRLSDEFRYDHEKIATFMSKSRSHISNTLRLLTLPEDVIGLLEEGKLTAGQARPLIGMPNASSIAEEIVAKKLSARSIENIKKNTNSATVTISNKDGKQSQIETDVVLISVGRKPNIGEDIVQLNINLSLKLINI